MSGDLQPIIARLRDQVTEAKRCRFAMSLPAALQDAVAAGTGERWIYVVPGSTTASANPDAAGWMSQQITVQFSVLVIAKNVKDSRGEGAQDDLIVVVKPLRKALQGWAPVWANRPVELGRGRIAGWSDFVSVWQEDFLTGYSESNEEST